MAYCVIERGTDDSLRFVIQGVFATREAARDALGTALADGSMSLSGDVCVADLDAATPVLVVLLSAPASTTAAPVVSESQRAAEWAFEPPAASDPTSAENLMMEPKTEPEIATESAPENMPVEPLVAEPESPASAESPVADETPAVEYVAAEPAAAMPAMEPPSVEPMAAAPVSAGWDSAALEIQESAGTSLADALRRATLSLEEEGIVAPASIESAAGLDLGAPPAIEVGPVPVTDLEWPDVTMDPLGAFASMGALEQPAVEAAPIIKNAPAEGEDAYMPRPVILGDYLDAPIAPAAAPVETGAAAPGGDTIDFAVSGDLQLETYTCDDCVYSNTCPKVGQTAPAECGAFQWRSE